MKSASAITRGLSTGDSDMRVGSKCQKRVPDLAASDRSASEVVRGAVEVSGRTKNYPCYAVYLACCINVSL